MHPKPRLQLPSNALEHVTKFFGPAAKVLCESFVVEPLPIGLEGAGDAHDRARDVAATLKDVSCGSDAECAYFPVVLLDADPSAPGFLEACGVGSGALAYYRGEEQPKFLVEHGTQKPLQLLTGLGDWEMNNIDEYLSTGALAAYSKAAGSLDGGGRIVRIVVCGSDEYVSAIVMALGTAGGDVYFGVLSGEVWT